MKVFSIHLGHENGAQSTPAPSQSQPTFLDTEHKSCNSSYTSFFHLR